MFLIFIELWWRQSKYQIFLVHSEKAIDESFWFKRIVRNFRLKCILVKTWRNLFFCAYQLLPDSEKHLRFVGESETFKPRSDRHNNRTMTMQKLQATGHFDLLKQVKNWNKRRQVQYCIFLHFHIILTFLCIDWQSSSF